MVRWTRRSKNKAESVIGRFETASRSISKARDGAGASSVTTTASGVIAVGSCQWFAWYCHTVPVESVDVGWTSLNAHHTCDDMSGLLQFATAWMVVVNRKARHVSQNLL